MSRLDSLIKEGIKSVWETDVEAQQGFLQVIAELRSVSIDTLKSVGAFFVPNDEYLARHCGAEIKEYEYDCYLDDEICRWSNWLVIPIMDISGTVVGLAGFNPFLYLKAREENDWSIVYYQYSRGSLFKKGRYVYSPPGNYEKALDDGYVFVVDGLFDAISLWEAGFNACAMMDSAVTEEKVVLLRFVKRVILLADNDDAGVKLYRTLRRRVPQLELFKQGKTKDIDELLKTEFRESTIQQLEDLVKWGQVPIAVARFSEQSKEY